MPGSTWNFFEKSVLWIIYSSLKAQYQHINSLSLYFSFMTPARITCNMQDSSDMSLQCSKQHNKMTIQITQCFRDLGRVALAQARFHKVQQLQSTMEKTRQVFTLKSFLCSNNSFWKPVEPNNLQEAKHASLYK